MYVYLSSPFTSLSKSYVIPSKHLDINLETPFSCEQTYEIWFQNWSSHRLAAAQVYRFPTQRARSTHHLDSLHGNKLFHTITHLLIAGMDLVCYYARPSLFQLTIPPKQMHQETGDAENSSINYVPRAMATWWFQCIHHGKRASINYFQLCSLEP